MHFLQEKIRERPRDFISWQLRRDISFTRGVYAFMMATVSFFTVLAKSPVSLASA